MSNLPLSINGDIYQRLNDIRDLKELSRIARDRSLSAEEKARLAEIASNLTREQVKAALDEGDQLQEVLMLRVDPETQETLPTAADMIQKMQGRNTAQLAQTAANLGNRASMLAVGAGLSEATQREFEDRGVNVKWFAKGDGVADDYEAIKRAVSHAVDKGIGFIYFPDGWFRIGRGVRKGGLELINVHNIEVYFSAGAVLYMDNLNNSGEGESDQANGIFVGEGSTNLQFINPKIIWKDYPSRRSQGYGLRVDGDYRESLAVKGIEVVNGYAKNTPQGGFIFHGVTDVKVKGITLVDTWADGVHFNACRGELIAEDISGINCKDDTLAFVTYYDIDNPDNPFVYNNGRPPFCSPDLDTRNNNHARAKNIYSVGGQANGVRICGAVDITVENIYTENKKAAFQVDSAIENRPGIGWTYLASKKIKINNVMSRSNNVAFEVNALGVSDWDTNRLFGSFDVDISNVDSENEALYSGYIRNCKGVRVTKVKAIEEFRVRNFSDVTITDLEGEYLNVIGISDWVGNATDLPIRELIGKDINVKKIVFSALSSLSISNVISKNAETNAIDFVNCSNVLGDIEIVNPNRKKTTNLADSTPLRLLRVNDVDLNFHIQNDGSPMHPFEVGGSATQETRSRNVRLRGIVKSEENETYLKTRIQGLEFGVIDGEYDVQFKYRNQPWRLFNRLPRSAASGPPTSGYHYRGEIVFNSNPISGGYEKWLCTASGTPGIWKGVGLIES